ncbi:MAG TPA: hypothetical protein VMU77_04705 [Acidimicrobiales bacterium]|nr:hypothetical protein [Acidimicrobiales bacterium]
MSSVSSGAAAGALQLAMALQQHLASDVASMGAGNQALAAGQALAALDAGGTSAQMGGGASTAVHSLDTYA